MSIAMYHACLIADFGIFRIEDRWRLRDAARVVCRWLREYEKHPRIVAVSIVRSDDYDGRTIWWRTTPGLERVTDVDARDALLSIAQDIYCLRAVYDAIEAYQESIDYWPPPPATDPRLPRLTPASRD